MKRLLLSVKEAKGKGFFVEIRRPTFWGAGKPEYLHNRGTLVVYEAKSPYHILQNGVFSTYEEANEQALLFAQLQRDTEIGVSFVRVNTWNPAK